MEPVGSAPRANNNMDYPGLDVTKLTDDQLMNKIAEIHSKLLYAYSYSNSQEFVEQLQWILESLQFEQSDRAQRRAWEIMSRKQPQVIETEPDLIVKQKDELPSKKKGGGRTGAGSLLKRARSSTAGTTEL